MDAVSNSPLGRNHVSPCSAKKSVTIQRQGTGPALPWTVSLLNSIRENPINKSVLQEVFGSNIPLTLAASSVDEAKDQGLYQGLETLNGFGVTLLINLAMRKFVDAYTRHWGKGLNHVLSPEQIQWRKFTLSLPLFAWLIGVEFFTPLLRNMITLKRTQEVDFTKLTKVRDKNGRVTNQEDPTLRKKHLQSKSHQALVQSKMQEYKDLAKRDWMLALPAALSLFGIGLMGMKHNWKMPKCYLDTPKILENILGKAHPHEPAFKKGIRNGVENFVSNLFDTQKYEAQKGKLNLIEEGLLEDGNWMKSGRLLTALVFALPTYLALYLYSRDGMEKPEIALRGVAYLVANVIFPNAVETFVNRHLPKHTHIPYIGGHQNISLLASLLVSTLSYTLLPVLIVRSTRPARLKHLEEQRRSITPPASKTASPSLQM
jgi:hypothetical protein